MNRRDPKAERPGNRPSGMPGNARFAGAGVVLGLIFIVINLAANYSVYTNNPDDYFGTLTPVFIPLVILCVALAVLLNTGKLVIVRLYRKLAVLVSAVYVGAILLNILQLVSYGTDRAALALIGTIVLVLLSPLQFLMWRDFRRSRWLDPDSLPGEWEIAAIRDPNSINYKRPKTKTPK